MGNRSILGDKPTVIIAAHNEAKVIKQTLSLLLTVKSQQSYQVVVVCNGCSDGTEELIQQEFPSVHCLVLGQASKALAIRHAELFNPGFPRLYLDADIELNAEDAEKLFAHGLDEKLPALIVPTSEVITQSCSFVVKRFYNVWYSTKYIQQMGYGAGTYLLNSSGRQRFGLWPELIADDGFIRSQFDPKEVHISKRCTVRVRAPKSLFSLLKVKTRSKLGNLELRDYLKNSDSPEFKNGATEKKGSQSRFNKTIYFSINIIAFGLAKWQYIRGNKAWHRDDSNR